MTHDEKVREIKNILSKWQDCCRKGQCCSSCIEDKEIGYGDDIDTCCCRHNDSCNIAEEIAERIKEMK